MDCHLSSVRRDPGNVVENLGSTHSSYWLRGACACADLAARSRNDFQLIVPSGVVPSGFESLIGLTFRLTGLYIVLTSRANFRTPWLIILFSALLACLHIGRWKPHSHLLLSSANSCPHDSTNSFLTICDKNEMNKGISISVMDRTGISPGSNCPRTQLGTCSSLTVSRSFFLTSALIFPTAQS